VARDDASRVRQKQLEQRELDAGQLYRPAATRHASLDRVELEITVTKHAVRGRGSPEQRAEPREELDDRKRFREVVIRAGVEALDAVVHVLARGQHQDRHLAPRADRPTRAEPVQFGHEHIQDNDIGRRRGLIQESQRLKPIARRGDVVALELKRTHDGSAQRLIVVDDEHPAGRATHLGHGT